MSEEVNSRTCCNKWSAESKDFGRGFDINSIKASDTSFSVPTTRCSVSCRASGRAFAFWYSMRPDRAAPVPGPCPSRFRDGPEHAHQTPQTLPHPSGCLFVMIKNGRTFSIVSCRTYRRLPMVSSSFLSFTI